MDAGFSERAGATAIHQLCPPVASSFASASTGVKRAIRGDSRAANAKFSRRTPRPVQLPRSCRAPERVQELADLAYILKFVTAGLTNRDVRSQGAQTSSRCFFTAIIGPRSPTRCRIDLSALAELRGSARRPSNIVRAGSGPRLVPGYRQRFPRLREADGE